MGYAGLAGMREVASEDVALEWHMTSNLYPAPPRSMIAVAQAAIEAVRNGDADERIEMPAGCIAPRLWHGSASGSDRESVPIGRVY
jgi:hypothetical protein